MRLFDRLFFGFKQATALMVVAALAGTGCNDGNADDEDIVDDDDTTSTTTGADGGETTGDGLDETGSPEPEPSDCNAETDEVIGDGGTIQVTTEEELEALRGYRVINGGLTISGSNLTNLDALGCLEEVSFELSIFANEVLADISGLRNVALIGTGCDPTLSWCGNISISNNPALTEIDVFNRVGSLKRLLSISENASLQSVTGFQNLEALAVGLIINNNDALTTIRGLRGLRAVGDQFKVTNNPSLCRTAEVLSIVNSIEFLPPEENGSTVNNDESC